MTDHQALEIAQQIMEYCIDHKTEFERYKKETEKNATNPNV